MIREEVKDLIDRKELLQELSSRSHLRDGLSPYVDKRLSATEILQTIYDFPGVQDYEAVWVTDVASLMEQCSWCKNFALYDSGGKAVRTKFCPSCGKRMREANEQR